MWSTVWTGALEAGTIAAGWAAPAAAAERVPVREALMRLTIVEEAREGYERARFRHWVDEDKDTCNTRAEVLIDEAVDAPEVGERCTVSGGRWYSSYDDLYVDDPGRLDIDHLVPLAEAWDSGASAWTAARRQAYANDLADPRALLAVTARTNRSKADKDPREWLPPVEAARCLYAAEWIAVKNWWSLSIDAAERDALTTLTDACPNTPIDLNPVPSDA